MNRRRPIREMFEGRIDRAMTDRLLSGRLDPDDAPPKYADVARIIRALTAPASPEDLALEGAAVGAAIRSLGEPRSTREERLQLSHSASWVRLGLVAVATVLLMTGIAAADVLPDRAQDAISDTLSLVGIDVPRATSKTSDPATIGHPASTGAEIAQLATETHATGVDKGARISRLASGGMSRAGEHGADAEASGRDKASDGPPNGPPSDRRDAPAEEPGHGSTTGHDASGGRNAAGATKAGEVSDGRSSAGRGNPGS